jgi:hypothetical protein
MADISKLKITLLPVGHRQPSVHPANRTLVYLYFNNRTEESRCGRRRDYMKAEHP